MLSERLKQLRLEAGLTQKQMAEYLNTSQPAYQNWEKGIRNPGKESIEKLTNFFNVSSDYLLGNSEIRNLYEKSELEILINQLNDEQKEKAIRLLNNLIKEK
ncbi:TPA: helix-turn-helix transcriptional regulator [Streptococcus suis]|nr:helix-turn-helix transcriptional regulator [Streptococcus suis]HEM3649690.1 helix-turn-helix transcriptional regulator [Streptococcus suis]